MTKYIFTLLLISFLFTCKKEEPTITTPTKRTFQDVKDDFNKININEGIHDEKLEFSTNNFWDFRIIAPKTEGTNTYPLVIDLHGAAGGAADAHKHSDCYLEEGFTSMDAFIISPNGENFLWNHLRNQEMVINLTQLAKQNWPIDPNKIMVTGYSNGGNGAWFYGEVHSNLFSAAIPMASSYSVIHTDGSTRKMPIPMYVIHGENDELFPLEITQDWVDKTKAEGSQIEFAIAKGLTHIEPCSYVSYLQDGVQWVQDSIW